jgi:hypothetical protein
MQPITNHGSFTRINVQSHSSFAGCYVAVDQKVDVRGLLSKYGLLSSKQYDDTAGAEHQDGWMEKFLTGSSSTLALAFLCNKALFPVRTPITLALTPGVARWACLCAGMNAFGPQWKGWCHCVFFGSSL